MKYCNFEEMKNGFQEWTLEEIMTEYVKTTKEIKKLQQLPFEQIIDEIEELDDIRDFLGHYLALHFCHKNGLYE